MNEAQLVRTIKAHIARGDKAAEKAEQHYIAAGQHLKTLKANHADTWADWEDLLRTSVGIGKSRASELMQIADGTKTIKQVRADTAERTAKTRALQSSALSPLRSGEPICDECGEPAEWIACPDCGGKVMHIPTGKIVATHAGEWRAYLEGRGLMPRHSKPA